MHGFLAENSFTVGSNHLHFGKQCSALGIFKDLLFLIEAFLKSSILAWWEIKRIRVSHLI